MTRPRMSLIYAMILIMAAFLGACGEDDSGSGSGDGSDAGRGSSTTDTGGTGGTDLGAMTDSGGGGGTGGTCGTATPCGGNADCGSGEFCNGGCCATTGGGGGGGGTGGGEACGDLTFEGECDGTTAAWCDTDSDTRQSVDCATFYPETPGTCTFVSDDLGYWCAVSEGGTCIFQGDEGPIPAPCLGDGAACVLGTADATCTNGVGACTEDGECLGEKYVLACDGGQAIAYDCAETGGTCTETGCADQGDGGPCGEGAFGDGTNSTCATGFVCNGEDGVCEAE